MKKPAAILAIVVVFTALAASLIWLVGDRIGEQGPGFGHTVHTGQASIGGPFSLIDQNGQTKSDKDFAGRYMLVYFGYTNCPDVCPTTLSVIARAMDKLGAQGKQIVPIFITVDPARDTPAVLKHYLGIFGPEFAGLTGPMPSIALVAKEYHVYYKKHEPVNGMYAVDHSNVIYLMGPDGNFIADYDETLGPDGLAKALEAQLSQS